MLILLPPSEGKASARSGRPLDLAGLSLPDLNPARERVLDALVDLCATADGQRARTVLGLTENQHEAVRRNALLRQAPALPAERLYTGVLYDALGMSTLSTAARRYARRSVLVLSGLWGAVRLGDRIPPYRCAMGVTLPGVGALAAHWRTALPAAMAEAAGGGPVLDLRSSAYLTAWRPTGEPAGRVTAVRVLHERTIAGAVTRSVVSHFNKATKGRMVRALAEAGARPRDQAQLVGALRDLGFSVEERSPCQLDIVVTEV